ncbi:MAG: hypothetical protein C4527_21675 [Candidatus Omnitrophota bacterium]|nr:MAG: hypothetical protein C4527_21675 [Candidatus Omnitrophota bacterium]
MVRIVHKPARFFIESLWLILIIGLAGVGHAQPQPTGSWDFDDSNNPLRATIGEDLALVGLHTSIPGLNAADGAVAIGTGNYYIAYHGIAPNGGGGYVNQYTLVFDVKLPELGVWYSLFNTNESNANDGDGWINPTGQIGVGATGYSERTITAGLWHRIAIAVDLAAGTIDYYLNGEPIHHGTGQALDGRFSLYSINDSTPWLLLFADNDGEDSAIYVSKVSVYDVALPADQVAALKGAGGNDAPVEGLPIVVSGPVKPSITVHPANPSGMDDIHLNGSEFRSMDNNFIAGSKWEVSLDSAFQKILITRTFTIENTISDEQFTQIELENSYFPLNRTIYARVAYTDDAGLTSPWSDTVSFTIGGLGNRWIVYSENFEKTEVNQLPVGWEEFNINPERPDPPAVNDGANDFYYPQLKTWSVQDYDYLMQLPWYPTWEDKASNPPGVVETDLRIVEGKSAHADTANFDSATAYYEAHLLSPEIDLSGVTDVVVAFHSNYVQNQDNIVIVEYTLDGGSVDMPETPPHGELPVSPGKPIGKWHPILYYMDSNLVQYFDAVIDAELTLIQSAEGLTFLYDDYVFAKEDHTYAELAPFVKPRINDHISDSKRFERMAIPALDNQPSVRIRWMVMGTYSWYYGFDNFQIWGVGGTPVENWSLY